MSRQQALPSWTNNIVPVDMDGAAVLLGISRRFLVDVIRQHKHYEPRGNRKVFYPEHINRLKVVISSHRSPKDALVQFVKARISGDMSDKADEVLSDCVSGSVYFVRCVDRIKIGFTDNWDGRFRILKTSCPYPVTVIALVPGSRHLELFLHRSFKDIRAHGEWFREQGDLRELIGLMVAANE